ncbi:hypothetical protein [Phaffia rhodozyma]|uniref:Uncharacterized protein n=1 Tax=Phaffia rhodozyma TaxID=264483 RepID=A0A0F7SUF7_PHARH|nr:hypothetical protein [Phaffia rhodozyma]
MSIAPTQFSRHRRSKSYPPRNPPSSGITFTLSDHFTSCLTLCFTCFPSFSRRPSEESSSDELGFPRDTLDSLLPAFSSEHGNHRDDADDDAAAWGSDALSLRSQFGTSKRSSRERNPRGAWRSWLGRLIAGRGERLSLEVEEGVDDERDFLEDPVIDWQIEDQTRIFNDNGVDRDSNVDRRSRTIDTLPDQWGAFLSAPLTRRSPNMTTSTSPSPSSSTLPTARAYPFPTSTSASTHLAEPNIPELEPSSTPGPLASISSSSSSSSASSSESKHRSSRSSKSFNKKKSPPPSNEVEPTPAEDVPPSV